MPPQNVSSAATEVLHVSPPTKPSSSVAPFQFSEGAHSVSSAQSVDWEFQPSAQHTTSPGQSPHWQLVLGQSKPAYSCRGGKGVSYPALFLPLLSDMLNLDPHHLLFSFIFLFRSIFPSKLSCTSTSILACGSQKAPMARYSQQLFHNERNENMARFKFLCSRILPWGPQDTE